MQACSHLVHQDPQVFLGKAVFQLVSPQHVLMHGVISPQGKNFVFLHVEMHEVRLSPFLQPVQIPLNGSTALHCTMLLPVSSHFFQFCVSCEPAEDTLCPCVQVSNKNSIN